MVYWNAGNLPTKKPGIALGMRARSAVPTAVGVTWWLAETCRPVGQLFIVPRGSGQRSLKSPVRSASEGTFGVVDTLDEGAEEVLLSFRHSSEKKKKKNVFLLSEL